jgi:hypothetical protein
VGVISAMVEKELGERNFGFDSLKFMKKLFHKLMTTNTRICDQSKIVFKMDGFFLPLSRLWYNSAINIKRFKQKMIKPRPLQVLFFSYVALTNYCRQ